MLRHRYITIAIALLLGIAAQAQHTQLFATARTNADSAEAVVQRFLKLMNYEALPHDQMLYIESSIVNRSTPHDTATLKRWYMLPHKVRIELWLHDTLLAAFHNDGLKFFRKYDATQKLWVDASDLHYHDMTGSYDFRGPLYNYAIKGLDLRYGGEYTFNGHQVYRVLASSAETYDRVYMFEKNSGLLFLCTETATVQGVPEKGSSANHVDWRAYEEYLPLGNSLIMSGESYQSGGTITFVRHHPALLPANRRLFQYD